MPLEALLCAPPLVKGDFAAVEGQLYPLGGSSAVALPEPDWDSSSGAFIALLLERCKRNNYCVLYDHRRCFSKGMWTVTNLSELVSSPILQLWSASLGNFSPQ